VLNWSWKNSQTMQFTSLGSAGNRGRRGDLCEAWTESSSARAARLPATGSTTRRCYRHGLRVSEAITLRRDEVNLKEARIWVKRLKNGLSVEQPITGDELRAIRRWLGTRRDHLPWLFLSERRQPLTRQSVN